MKFLEVSFCSMRLKERSHEHKLHTKEASGMNLPEGHQHHNQVFVLAGTVVLDDPGCGEVLLLVVHLDAQPLDDTAGHISAFRSMLSSPPTRTRCQTPQSSHRCRSCTSILCTSCILHSRGQGRVYWRSMQTILTSDIGPARLPSASAASSLCFLSASTTSV